MEDLPGNVMVDILSRLPVKTIIHCKCVCKKWLALLSDSYFANLHYSRSPASLMVFSETYEPGILKSVEVEDELDHHLLHHDPIMRFDLNLAPIPVNFHISPVGSVDGLICLWQFYHTEYDNVYICNPITREYTILPQPKSLREEFLVIFHCIGVGSLTQEYKVIRISNVETPEDITLASWPYAEVYTLGTGRWRSLGHVLYTFNGMNGQFLNGRAHYIICGNDSPENLCAFDFDKETFELFPSPPSEVVAGENRGEGLGVLKGCLCQCDTYDSRFTLWVMKEYGIKKSWHKELVVKQSISHELRFPFFGNLYTIECFKDGTVLMAASDPDEPFIYCPRGSEFFDKETFHSDLRVLAYRPTFHRLQNHKNERVQLF